MGAKDLERVAFLEWVKRNGEMTKSDWIELEQLKQLSTACARKERQTYLKLVIDAA